MSGARDKLCRLSPAARRDLDEIWEYTAGTWSPDQAEAYIRGLWAALDRLSGFPEANRERTEITPPVRLWRYRAHLVIYRIAADHLDVIRILHTRRNWQALLKEGPDQP